MIQKEGNDLYINLTRMKISKKVSPREIDAEYKNCECKASFVLLGYENDISILRCENCGTLTYIP